MVFSGDDSLTKRQGLEKPGNHECFVSNASLKLQRKMVFSGDDSLTKRQGLEEPGKNRIILMKNLIQIHPEEFCNTCPGHRNHEYGGYGNEPFEKEKTIINRKASPKSKNNIKPNHVLLYTIMNPIYPITVEVLHTISAPSGQVQRIVIFKKNGVQAMVKFDTVKSAIRAKET
ncbi:polypyrimidine tract-binding protein homolog 1-like [Solenopsis invicta]|uniref:polypyrimidine tract-binding protein homolog 1-like n=1 Tax=Solenopsis invicta TaxID=13686 RepID=UPI00193DAC9E|nr:polypyrimidine tract-binding protein homolog 1-like [Solenopsis invicta]